MNDFIRFQFKRSNYYSVEVVGKSIGLLAMFLGTEIRKRVDTSFTDWLDESNIQGIQGNQAIIDLLDNGIIEIRDILDDGDFDDPVFLMPKEEYRKMVLQWQEIVKQRPKEIIVTWDGKEISVEGRS